MKTQLSYTLTRLHAYTLTRLHAYTLTRLISLLLFLFNQSAFAQSSNNQIKDVVMPSPATTAFAKYVDIPVSYHTGVPNISIPICMVTEGSLQVPVSLSYHASGIRMAEVASWVGLGWNLSAVGQVTRTVNGYPDEKDRGYLRDRMLGVNRETLLVPGGFTFGAPGGSTFGEGVDYEPDMFSFSAGNYSGKFYIHPTEGVILLPKQDIKVIYDNPITGTDGEFDYFTIITPVGDKYHFGKVANNGGVIGTAQGQYEYADLPSNLASQLPGGGQAAAPQTRQTWYLVKIEDTNGTNSIDITYERESFSITNRIPDSEYRVGASCGGAGSSMNTPFQYGASMNPIQNSLRLKKITNSSGTIEVNFNANTIREDMGLGDDAILKAKRLDEILIRLGTTDDYVKKIVFSYTYLSDANASCNAPYCKRLRLTQLQEVSGDGSITIPPHVFEYEGSGNYPSRLSKAIDHWGFYNGAAGNNSISLNIPSRGANREPNETYAKVGVLKKITYPTGGNTEFLFESNNYLAYNTTAPTLCGGLRIKKVTVNEGTQSQETNYDYLGDNSAASSGTLITKPNYEVVYEISRALEVNAVARMDIKTETTTIPLNDWNGYHVYYNKITETKLGLGSTIYRYETELWSNYNNSCIYGNTVYPFRGTPIYMESDKVKSVVSLASNGSTVSTSTYDNKLSSIGTSANDLPVFRVSNYFGSTTIAHFVTLLSLPKVFEYGRLRSKTEVTDGIETKTDYTYSTNNLHNNPVEIKTTNSTGKVHSTKIFYPLDNPTALSSDVFINRNITAIPLYSENYVGTTFIGGSQVAYDFSNFGHFVPKTVYSYTKDHWSKLETTIEEFNNKGLPTVQRTSNYTQAVYYDWDAQNRIKSKILGRTWGTNRLSTFVEYIGNTTLANKITDENGLIKKYDYDKLMRLKTVYDRMKPDGSDIQATINYTYQYKNATTNPYNFLSTSATFKGVATPLSTTQYIDGLGRPVEVVKEGYTPNGQHQKNYVAYDALGRQFRTYLPFESNSLGFEAAPTSPITYAQTEYETSPLSRPIKQTNVDGTTVLSSYGANNATDVRIITDFNGNTNPTFYAANLLSKTTMTDENGKQTLVFKDKLGRVLLTRKFLSGQFVETYNIYDDFGQLVAVLPPGSVDANGTANVNLIFKYT